MDHVSRTDEEKERQQAGIKHLLINELNHWAWSHVHVLLIKDNQATYQIRNVYYGRVKKGEQKKVEHPLNINSFSKQIEEYLNETH
jgi:hypothetical protein